MRNYQARLRQLHRIIAPIMILPILLTLITGSVYQMVDLSGTGEDYDWLLDWHKGHFGSLNLEIVYPFLNALGLLTLAITGITMWFRMRRSSKNRSQEM
ncbi:PepSY domain-containing protein [Argonema antarcticum]|uniref:PepSY domain-containing protein n=1 Tax=Argonema antarcticum TaxID=2942763 RepID=UPI002012FA9F|nr:PepSY domain-containing protein [Argonema antarcticum]MCL1473131.1 PepSY domain-containing protein [Argonema antarcticum A004/B2]